MSYKILRINKPVGITPIDFWLSYRTQHFPADYSKIESQILPKGAICGKLDPMAQGEMIILLKEDWLTTTAILEDYSLSFESDNSFKNKSPKDDSFKRSMDALCNHEKIYEFGLLVGLSTDSDDRLGLLSSLKSSDSSDTSNASNTSDTFNTVKRVEIEKELLDYANNLREQEYHVFSAKRAHNKDGLSQPLWWWARNNRLHEIEVPKHECFIKEIEIKGVTEASIYEFINETIALLETNKQNLADFEIEKIIASYKNAVSLPEELGVEREPKSHIIHVRVRVTGGTFIRQICRDLIRKTGIPLMCTYIDRKIICLR